MQTDKYKLLLQNANISITAKLASFVLLIMKTKKLYEEDLIEQFVHSSGKGGQNVNKVATCVYLKHIPTGIEVKCQKYRTQAKNREEARRLLLEKILKREETEKNKKKNATEKEKRKNRKKSYAQKHKILEEKRHQSDKKKLRKKIIINHDE